MNTHKTEILLNYYHVDPGCIKIAFNLFTSVLHLHNISQLCIFEELENELFWKCQLFVDIRLIWELNLSLVRILSILIMKHMMRLYNEMVCIKANFMLPSSIEMMLEAAYNQLTWPLGLHSIVVHSGPVPHLCCSFQRKSVGGWCLARLDALQTYRD